jgi:osmotically-inducible protein OsmY
MRACFPWLIFGLLLSAAAVSSQVQGSPRASGAATEEASPNTVTAPFSQASEQSSPETPLAPDGDNQELRGKIMKTLRAQPALASSSFDIEVSDSQIELSGSVPTAREKEIARRIAQSYGSNRSVVDTKVAVRNAGQAQGTRASQP